MVDDDLVRNTHVLCISVSVPVWAFVIVCNADRKGFIGKGGVLMKDFYFVVVFLLFVVSILLFCHSVTLYGRLEDNVILGNNIEIKGKKFVCERTGQ